MARTRSPIARLKRMRLSGVDAVVQHDLIGAESEREEQLAAERRERHAALAVVLLEHVVVAPRIVELACFGLDDDVVARELAVVEARLVDRERRRRHRREIADEEHGQPFAGHLVDGPERQPVAVGERQALVDPGAVGQAGSS